MIKPQESKSVLSECWPPKWFFSYSDLATQLMTFFIILSTMLSLDIPIYFLADKKLQSMLKEGAKVVDLKLKIKTEQRLSETDREILRGLEKLEMDQIYNLVDLQNLKNLMDNIQGFIQERKLQNFIRAELYKFKVKITPSAPLLFKSGTAELKPQAMGLIDEIGSFLDKYPTYLIRIEGHTDNKPIHNNRFSSNWELSMARANSVLKYLMKKYRVPVERIEAAGYGEHRPVAPNDTDENRAKNRRVVFEIMPMKTLGK
jgi:chemotaxis protein MotB